MTLVLLALSLRTIFLLLAAGVISVLVVMASGVNGPHRTGVSHLIEHLRRGDTAEGVPPPKSSSRSNERSRRQAA